MLRIAWFALVIVVTLSAGQLADVLAQQTQTDTEAPARRQAPLSSEEQLEQAELVLAQGSRLSTRLGKMLDEARRESDIIRITCLNDKLTQVNANLRNAQSRYEALKNAVDRDRRDHEYTVLSVLKQKFQSLEQEANQCIGQDIFETGATTVSTDIDSTVVPGEVEPSRTPPEPGLVTPAIPKPLSGTF